MVVPPSLPNLIANGDFSAGLSNWLIYGLSSESSVVVDLQDGALHFYRPTDSQQAVVFQNTETPLAANAPLQAQFLLGNAHTERKRVTVLLYDTDFSDLSVCTFWLPPKQPPTMYGMEARTTRAWTAAHLSFYASTADDAGWYQIDDVKLTSDPLQPVTHTACFDLNAP
ncbi:MAG: hypothetical protein SGI73_19590 [Chloroflexota bacterium]|nr:hypothetical protein [Chloroflexota bacterium]